ncbi:FRG domain-containing protein [Marinifilum fragile]|uniref:FRG domain-containing protein n=1 Tax=Marinifilum fragile TaxID=570161 RepID=UPI002AA6A071|nr:FRG domain-containing protein [Marinifilum fragile]
MTKEVKSWQEFKTLIADNSQLEWIFRGQTNSNWLIRSSLERSGIMDSYDEGEERMLYEFKRVARHYLNEHEIPKTLIDWLALLQHHGAPTRLIDFTKSPYVAAFFAFQEYSDESEFVSIWIANKIYFYQRAIYYLQENDFANLDCKHYSYKDETFQKIFNESRTGELDCVIPVESHFMNERYYIQQSVFLTPINPYKTFSEQLDFLDEIKDFSLMKILIPKSERNTALRDLEKMNITHASLFPGLDGYAKYLGTKFSTLSSIGEQHKCLLKLQSEGLIMKNNASS